MAKFVYFVLGVITQYIGLYWDVTPNMYPNIKY